MRTRLDACLQAVNEVLLGKEAQVRLAMACLLECGATKLADVHHPHARPLPDAPKKAVDRRLAVFSSFQIGL